MGYCFMTITKVKTMTGLVKRAEHNLREKEVLNADPERANLNEEIVSLNGQEIADVWEQKKDEALKGKEPRKNAVKALEVVLSVPKEDAAKIDLEKWKKENLKWLQDTFNKGDKENLLSVVYHGDESNAHIHALVIPITEDDRLSAFDWLAGRKQMIELQDSYAKSMKQFGLKRGLEGSKAKHKDIARMYAKIDQNINTVEKQLSVQPGEDVKTYHDRVVDYMKTRTVAQERQLDDKDREIMEAKHEAYQWKKRYESLGLDAALKENENIKAKEHSAKEKQGLEREYGSMSNIRKRLDKMKQLEEAINHHPNRQFATQMKLGIEELLLWQQQQEKEKEKKKELEKKAKSIEEKLFG